jgi:hypothetical protein
MNTLSLPDPQVLILASGSSDGAEANARGHLFERLFALLLSVYGYDAPSRERLNVTSNGIELDVVAKHGLTGVSAIAECKAYSSPVPAHMLDAFYGKLVMRRFSHPDAHGFFVAIPRLSQPGAEQAAVLAAHDTHFTLISASVLSG